MLRLAFVLGATRGRGGLWVRGVGFFPSGGEAGRWIVYSFVHAIASAPRGFLYFNNEYMIIKKKKKKKKKITNPTPLSPPKPIHDHPKSLG